MSIGTIVTMGYQIGNEGLVTTMGYSQGAAPPPPPPAPSTPQPYGPALWGDKRDSWIYGENPWVDYDQPTTRAEKRKKRELERRLEAGVIKELVIPKKLREEVKEVVTETVRLAVQGVERVQTSDFTPLVSRIAFDVATELVLELKREKNILRQLEQNMKIKEEEDEAMEVLTLWMLQ